MASDGRGHPLAARVLGHKDELGDALVDLWLGDALERQSIETAPATVYALMTGDIAHPSDVVARELDRWLARNKHLAKHITRRQRSPNPRVLRRR